MSSSQPYHTKLPKLVHKCNIQALCYIVGTAATIGRAFSGVGQPPVMGLVADALIQQGFQSRDTITTIYFVSIILAALLMPLVGYFFDIFGARKTGITIVLLLSASCFLLAYGNIHESIYSLLLVFVAIRFFGQGALNLVSTNMINQWWTTKRRLIQGCSSFLYSFVMFGILPPWIIWLQNKYGWQHTLGILGSFILCIMVPICYLFYMDDVGMYGFPTIVYTQQLYPMDHEQDCEMNEAYWHSEDDEDDNEEEESVCFIQKDLSRHSDSIVLKQKWALQCRIKDRQASHLESHWMDAMKCCYFWKFSWVSFHFLRVYFLYDN